MPQHPNSRKASRQSLPAENFFASLERILHLEPIAGFLLLGAATVALILANSPFSDHYHNFWHIQFGFSFNNYQFSQSLHFIINDVLMTIFFLVIGMEIRREIHNGSLSSLPAAILPLAAAIGGVILPALIFLGINTEAIPRQGWAIPMATDIAFAIAVLALLGKRIPGSVRIFLLSLAIIDDIIAIFVLALFYSTGLNYSGLLIASVGILFVKLLQRSGFGNAWAYVLPGAIIWCGLLYTGIHPTLAGVILGFMTPVFTYCRADNAAALASEAINTLQNNNSHFQLQPNSLLPQLKQLRYAQRELLPPVSRIPLSLHPWVTFTIMPLFALANAGVSFDGINLADSYSTGIIFGIVCGLLFGKPLGILLACFLFIKLGWSKHPEGTGWPGIVLVSCLAGVGFTMAIFIATLSFSEPTLLAAAKAGVLLASVIAGGGGYLFGRYYYHRAN